ncbi:MAG: hypothetical protein EOO99_02660 [Pedobacter sp.]|nr:MAG: hypothetical protein EOO99_02660 [Pedobacter sp.]
MKRNSLIALTAVTLGLMVASCSNDNRNADYSDSIYEDTMLSDTGYIMLDSNGVMDTAGRRDSTYRGSPTTGNGSGTGNPHQRND